jgi:hypothetical protein
LSPQYSGCVVFYRIIMILQASINICEALYLIKLLIEYNKYM